MLTMLRNSWSQGLPDNAMAKRVEISLEIAAPRDDVFAWFYHSENFTASPIVFTSAWRPGKRYDAGSQRDIIMVAGWYHEEITAVDKGHYIRYRVRQSFPAVRQDFTEIAFTELPEVRTLVKWTIEIEVPSPIFRSALTNAGGRMAEILYSTIMRAGRKKLEHTGHTV